jgi:hypothetical protein
MSSLPSILMARYSVTGLYTSEPDSRFNTVGRVQGIKLQERDGHVDAMYYSINHKISQVEISLYSRRDTNSSTIHSKSSWRYFGPSIWRALILGVRILSQSRRRIESVVFFLQDCAKIMMDNVDLPSIPTLIFVRPGISSAITTQSLLPCVWTASFSLLSSSLVHITESPDVRSMLSFFKISCHLLVHCRFDRNGTSAAAV